MGISPGRRRKAANPKKRSSFLQPVIPQPQPDGAEAEAPSAVPDAAGPTPSAAGPPVASVVVGPSVVAVPLPLHRAHYDLRHTFSGVASVESSSGEAFHVGKTPIVGQPSIPGGPVAFAF